MNKKFFGMSVFGKHTIIRLRVKLNEKELATIKDSYSNDLFFIQSTKGCTKIEGCLHNTLVNKFYRTLQLAMLQTKRAELDDKIELQTVILYGKTLEEMTYEEYFNANLDEI